VPVIVTVVLLWTDVTSMLTVLLVDPAAIVTFAPTRATSVLLLESVTTAPPDGAAAVSLIVATVRPWL